MRVLLAAAVLAITAVSGAATPVPDKDGMRWTIIDPPESYVRHMPKLNMMRMPNYGPKVKLFEMPQDELKDMCSFWTAKSEHLACAFPQTDPCEIYVNSDVPLLYRQRLIQHEVAHCMGWPSDHPDH